MTPDSFWKLFIFEKKNWSSRCRYLHLLNKTCSIWLFFITIVCGCVIIAYYIVFQTIFKKSLGSPPCPLLFFYNNNNFTKNHFWNLILAFLESTLKTTFININIGFHTSGLYFWNLSTKFLKLIFSRYFYYATYLDIQIWFFGFSVKSYIWYVLLTDITSLLYNKSFSSIYLLFLYYLYLSC